MSSNKMKTLKTEQNFLAIEEKYSDLENSKIVILPAPYEHTVSYGKGAGAGPEAILKASSQVEFFDIEFDRELCFSTGIATLEPLDFKGKHDKEALDYLQSVVEELLNLDKFVVTVGGEHTISAAPIAAHYKRYPNMSVLHFDAHADLRQSYEGNPYSHACVMARVADFISPEYIVQVGIRALSSEEANFIEENDIATFYASDIKIGYYGKKWINHIVDVLTDEVYITFDLDFFDPAIMPATGTPEPDGFLYNDALKILRRLNIKGKRIVGFDVVELAPIEGLHHPDLTAARLIYKMLNYAMDDVYLDNGEE